MVERYIQGLPWKPEGYCQLGRPRNRPMWNIWISQQEFGCGLRTWLMLLRTGTRVGYFESSKEPPGSVECGDFLEKPKFF